MHHQGESALQRLTNRSEFERFAADAKARWESLWGGENTVVTVGVGSSSIAKGAETVLDAAASYALHRTGIIVRQTGVDGADWMEVQVSVKRPGAPVVHYANVTPETVADVIEGKLQSLAVGVDGDAAFDGIPPLNQHPFFKYQHRIVLRDVGVIDPESIEEAIARGAYSAYIKVLFEMSAEDAIAEMTAANLRGRGGAGFPAGIKWESGRKARNNPKFIVCNSHEGEPNVYNDRRIHEGDPHRILEGLLIAAIVVGAERAYNYIGGEYPLAIKRFRKAVADAERLGLIG
ncbi:MAG: NADH-quinone oxidoreductase subunit F, partial [Chloroflexota bacterium]|nr:NADH-quinone oxidoreductase subunit F [Chloroflexota bacterium]